MTFREIGSFCLLCWLGALGQAQTKREDHLFISIQRQGRASVSVASENFKNGQVEIHLSDSLNLIVEVSGGPDLEVANLDSGCRFPGWTVRRLGIPESISSLHETQNKPSIRVVLVLDPQKPGELPITLPPFRFREGSQASTWQTIQWQPIPVQVVTDVLQSSMDELRDVAPPEDLPGNHTTGNWVRQLALAAGILMVLPAGYWLWRRWRGRPAPLPPDQWALKELERIEASELLKSGQEDRLGTLLSDMVRHYLDLRFHLSASSRTTTEFLANQSSDGPLSMEQQRVIRELLDHCDLNKFARQTLSQAEIHILLDQTRWLIEQTSQAPIKPTA